MTQRKGDLGQGVVQDVRLVNNLYSLMFCPLNIKQILYSETLCKACPCVCLLTPYLLHVEEIGNQNNHTFGGSLRKAMFKQW